MLTGLVVLGAIVGAFAAFVWSMGPETSGRACPACEGRELRDVAPGAYVCRTCGYRGGPGWQEIRKVKELSGIEKLDPDERRKRATALLHEALGLLVSARADRRIAASDDAFRGAFDPSSGFNVDVELDIQNALDAVESAVAHDPQLAPPLPPRGEGLSALKQDADRLYHWLEQELARRR